MPVDMAALADDVAAESAVTRALVAGLGVRVTLGAGAAICGLCALAATAAMLGRKPQTPPPDGAPQHTRTGFVDVLRTFP